MTCSRKFDRLLQAACLGLVGIFAAAGCGGSSNAPKDAAPGPDGPNRPDVPTADVAPPVLVTASPLVLDFGTVDVGSTSSTPFSVTVTNLGPATSLTPEIVQPSPFTLAGNTCNTLPVNGTCIISVSFTPTIQGPAAGTLIVAGTVKVSLVGIGSPPADFTVTDHVDLGTVLVGASATGKVTVTATNPLTDLVCSVQSAGNVKADPTSTTCPATGILAKGASCFVGFTFSSTTPGAKTGDEVICGAGKVTKITSITATVVSPARLVITPVAGSTAAITGKSTGTVPFTVANAGDVKTGTITAAITSASPEFTVSGSTCGVGLLPLGNCIVTVTFQPTTDGTKTATLTVTDTSAPAGTLPTTALVTGVATGPSNLTITGPADLGTVALGAMGTPVTFTIKNIGGSDAQGVTVTSNNTAFVLGNDGCTGQTLVKTTGTCTVTVTFAPPANGLPGAQSGLLTASSAGGGNPFNLPLTATATKPAALTITPNPLAFEGISLNTPSGDGILTITNTGGATTGALTVPGALGNGFVMSANNCLVPLAPTQSCTIAVRFTPGAISQATWTLTVTSASGATGSASLTGTGKQPNVLDISPRDVKGCGELRALLPTGHAAVSVPGAGGTGGSASLQCFEDTAMGQADGSFPKAPVGATAPVTFIITNSNTATAGGINLESGLVTVTIGGTNAADFVKVSSNCGPSLQPGQTCTYVVSFKPTAPGLRTAMISVTSANGGNVGTNMEGIGLPPIEIQPCGYGTGAAGVAPFTTLGTTSKLDCINKLAKDGTDESDRTGLDFGQVSLGADCNPMNVKWFLVTINSSTATDSMNLITAILTDAAMPSNFRIANLANVDQCNNQNKDVSKGPAWCWISVEFMPQGTTTGAKAASLGASGGSGGSATVNLTGTATGPLTIKPSTAEFGTVVVNEAAATTVTLTVMNWSATNTLGPVMASLSGAAAADFRVTLDTCTDYYSPDPNHPGLPPQAAGTSACSDLGANTCNVAYRFFPTAVGNRTATFTLTAGAVTSTATLHGTGVAETTISSTPATVAFGGIVLSNKSDWQTVTVNAGAGGVETGTLEFGLAGVQSDQFEIATGLDAGTCGNTNTARLGGGNPLSCTVKVRFVPTVLGGLGAAKATLLVVDPRDRTLTQKIALTGTGLTQLTIAPTTADFGLVAAGEAVTTVLTFTVTNRGTATISNPALAVTAPFTWNPAGAATDCPNASGTITGNNGTCLVLVRLGTHDIPGIISTTPGVLITGASGNDSRAAAQLSATVQADAHLELVGLPETHATTAWAGPINLGSVASGGTGSPVTLLYRNTGGHDTSQIHYYFSSSPGHVRGQIDTAALDYFVVGDPSADGCVGNTLKGGQYCKVQVNFKPTHTGALPIAFELEAALGGSPTGVDIAGYGLDPVSDKVTITPSFLNLIGSPVSTGLSTTVATGDTTSERAKLAPTPFTIQNNATTTLTLSGNVSVTTPFLRVAAPTGTQECGATLNPGGQTCLVWVVFLPQSGTPPEFEFVPGVVSVNGINAGIMGKVRSGTVLSVWNAFVGASGIDFGSVARNLPSAAMPFTVMNIGDAPTYGNATVKIYGAGTSPPTSQFSATGCGSALAAFNTSTPSGAATCAAQAIFTPSIAGVGLVPATSPPTIQVEADATGTQWDGTADTGTLPDIHGYSADLYGTCINPASLGITPTGTVTFPAPATPIALASAETFFTITNGTATSSLPTIPDFQTTTPITISMTDSTNFLLDLNPTGAGPTCEQSKDQVTGNLILRGNQQCAVGVYFTPQAMPASGTAFTTTVTATATTGGSPQLVFNATGRDDLSVTVPAPPTASVAFGSVAAGSVSAEPPTGITITNASGVGAPISGLLTTAVTGQFFVAEDTCNGVSLAAGGSCVVSLQFAPTTAGAKTGTLTVSGTPGGTATMALTGTGI